MVGEKRLKEIADSEHADDEFYVHYWNFSQG